jgi:hypothetical protein
MAVNEIIAPFQSVAQLVCENAEALVMDDNYFCRPAGAVDVDHGVIAV